MSKAKHIQIDINDIVLLDENPRTISDSDLNKLCEDIQKDPQFLFQRPPLINHTDAQYICYAGNQRIKAAKQLGHKKIYCFVEKDVPEQLQKERMLKDNLHRGKWDREKLLDLDFEIMDLKDLGFDEFELDLWGKHDPEYPDEFTAPKKDNPPTIKITFIDTKQMNQFEQELSKLIHNYKGAIYSVSEGEL